MSPRPPTPAPAAGAAAEAQALEAFLARLYTDAALRQRFLTDPRAEAKSAGLPEATAQALAAIDRDGLVLTAESLAQRRTPASPPRPGRWARLRRLFQRSIRS